MCVMVSIQVTLCLTNALLMREVSGPSTFICDLSFHGATHGGSTYFGALDRFEPAPRGRHMPKLWTGRQPRNPISLAEIAMANLSHLDVVLVVEDEGLI